MKLYKGSIYPISVVFAPCHCQDPEVALTDLVINFFTTDPEYSVEFSGDTISISGFTATVVFQPAQLDALEDGVLRFVSEFNYGGSAIKWSCATDKYLVTPPSYTPIDIVTEDEVDEMITEALADYYTSAQTQEAISSALTDYATSAETAEAISTATQGMVTSTQINKIWTGTQAEYDQISPKLNTTLYFIKES